MRPARNAPCPCGSGLKYKRCHEIAEQSERRPSKSGILPLVLLAVLVAVGGVAAVIGIAKAPAGPGSGGRVWSKEHNHWHNAAPGRSDRSGPPGTAPPGKMWSAEHGHWHDASAAGQPTPLPDGPSGPGAPGTPPPGQVWSPEHGHWHKVDPAAGSGSLPSVEVTLPPAPPR